MTLFRRRREITLSEAQGLNQEDTFEELTKRLSNHIYFRISCLLKDIGRENADAAPGILDSIELFISNEIRELHYDDAKEMLCDIIQEGRLPTKNHKIARKVVVDMVQRTLANMNLGNVRYSSKNHRRELQTLV